MLKKETRILGLSAPRRTHLQPIVGVIFRGSFWLDGLLMYIMDEKDSTYVMDLAATIKKSRQYSQIRAAIFSRENILPNGFRDFYRLAEEIDIPILVLQRNKLKRSMNSTHSPAIWSPNEDRARIDDLFAIGCANEAPLPEAVRMADLIISQL